MSQNIEITDAENTQQFPMDKKSQTTLLFVKVINSEPYIKVALKWHL